MFTKMAREIAVCVKESGGDQATNSRLRDIVAKAKGLNVPNENIDRAIKKASEEKGDDYESIRYEGYGPNGVAVIVEALTENRNRTAGNMRHYFDKFGGNLGQVGCVGFLFNQKGILLLEADGLDEEKVMEDSFDAGADDFDMGEDMMEITCEPQNLSSVREALEKKGYKFDTAEVQYIPVTETAITNEDDLRHMGFLLDHLDEDEDVQNVWHNMQNEEDLDR
ncbi:MAG: YebC/PmpR family DNA-binding transcriptional regulator [Oscillospiraceae bacterium]